MGKPYLDLIVTHCNEPWELGKPFFDMLQYQQCADLDAIDVTIVQDGNDNALPWDKLLGGYSYTVRVVTLPNHRGVAAARNAGINKSRAEWLMFCNFDDMFGDVSALAMILAVLPTDECDLIWMKIAQECKWFTGVTYINTRDDPDFSVTDGKLYRRQFLNDKYIRFPHEPEYYYREMFNQIMLAETPAHRIMNLTTDFYPYFKTFRPDSYLHTPEAFEQRLHTSLQRDIEMAKEMKKRFLDFEYQKAVVRAVCKAYYAIYEPDKSPKPPLSDEFLDFYSEHRSIFHAFPWADVETVRDETEIESMNMIQNIYNEHKREFYFVNDDISFRDWIKFHDDIADGMTNASAPQRDVQQTAKKPEIIPASRVVNTDDPHVVVYCGTFDVYTNMLASLKSLLCNTPVDKVYFLIEDDVFPYDLPDIVETINVKSQTYFPHDGPNFENSWTYMCMIRAAFPEMFPQYSRILSLDIDVVIDDNVSDLWDYDISDYYLAGVPERQRQKTACDPIYINFGVVMMNLDKLRADNKQQEIVTRLNTRRLDCPEQTAYNTACANHILPLSAEYNYTAYSHITGDAERQRIIHYAGQKFWRHYSNVKQYADLDWVEVIRRQNKLKEGEGHE